MQNKAKRRWEKIPLILKEPNPSLTDMLISSHIPVKFSAAFYSRFFALFLVFILEFTKTSKVDICVPMYLQTTNFKVLSNSVMQIAVLRLLLF